MLMNILKGSIVFPYVISMLRTATASSAKKKKNVFIKWVNTTLKMRIRQAHSIFLPKL